ncbi:phage GP46 family protein [Myxococcota bacterium]|nr:phage GP46 family protein [Myxococcota bacterium]
MATVQAGDLVQLTNGDFQAVANTRAALLEEQVRRRLLVERGSDIHSPTFGSRLHELKQATRGEAARVLAEAFAREALQPLVDAGQLRHLQVKAQLRTNGIEVTMTATSSAREPLTFTVFTPF